jgi:hypothetical protein
LTKIFILVIMGLPLISSENLFLGFKIQAFSKDVLATQTADSGRQFSDCRAEALLSGVIRDFRDGKNEVGWQAASGVASPYPLGVQILTPPYP